MVRRLDPRVSYLDVEKSFYKNKGKMCDYAVSIPSNVIVKEPRPPKKLDTYQKNPQSVKDSNVNVSRPTMSRRLKAMKSSEGSIQDDDFELTQSEPNEVLKMRKTSSEDVSNISLLRKSEVVKPNFDSAQQNVSAGDSFRAGLDDVRGSDSDTEISNKGEVSSEDFNAINTVISSVELQ
ncbi:hypothetical protein ZIOFF_028582 [Zingiber officinale]|uniref:Uncharacterized protein n=1 Tax=Zingiber officinale TaxID=94328 RepID=A0A8J5GLH7_ZINOF|nr:hypothetical protein ZIOFF_028582 [Zingiber officinale]